MLFLLIIFIFCIKSLSAVVYDCYSGKPATSHQIEVFYRRNNAQYCLIDVKPCVENEWRRVDSSCNNLKHPSRGMIRTPNRRVLTPDFSPNYEPRKTEEGEEMPSPRPTRTRMLKEGKESDLETTQLVTFYLLATASDVNSIHDILNYVMNTTECCTPRGKSNYICAPVEIPENDPVHRYSHIKCQNLTKPQSHQYFGCASFGDTQFARMVFATPVFDLSNTYSAELDGIDQLRTFENGLLKIEIDNGKEFPPTNPNIDPKENKCILNQLPRETRCMWHQVNGELGSMLMIVLFYRQHNYIARQLAELNPCWDDERLFHTARDINIATFVQIFYYELLPILLGEKNLQREGLSVPETYRDWYDENEPVQVSDEYIYVMRWFHTMQEGNLKFYDTDGYYIKEVSLVELTSRMGFLPLDNNLEGIFQGSFRQYGKKSDFSIDPDLSERVLGPAQTVSDVASNDLAKGRLFGFPSYVKYREFCARKPHKTFESLSDVMKLERIHQLREIYKNINDVDLMAGIWAEDIMPGSMVPYTVYCLMVEQLQRSITADRYWFERSNRPYAFTISQLKAIRNITIAGVFCTSADGVTKIQPNAFYSISSENPLTDCSSPRIGKLDLSAWKDQKCNNDYQCNDKFQYY